MGNNSVVYHWMEKERKGDNRNGSLRSEIETNQNANTVNN